MSVELCCINPKNILYQTTQNYNILHFCRYLDGTFFVVKKPFHQLYSIHAFVKSPTGRQKQEPMMFILMSGRSTADYKLVFRKVCTEN